MNKVIIGIDAGGTKTLGVLFALNGKEIVRFENGVGSPAVDKIKALQNVKAVIDYLFNKMTSKDELVIIQIGMSGMGILSLDEKQTFIYDLEKKYKVKVSLENDAVIGLYSIIKDKYAEGVLVLSGTGSAVFGKNKDHQTMLSGGWGHLLNEQGSAFSLVSNAVLKIIAAFEQNLKLSAFQKKFLEHLGINDCFDIKKIWYHKSKNELAAYARFINDQALRKDEEALILLKESGYSLGQYVLNLANKLKFSDNFIVGFRGGFVNNAFGIKDAFINYLKEHDLKVIYEAEEAEPIIGTFYLALRNI
ncbi:MAG: hypothetical protein FWE36_01155 [Erysipelotrichales bacterium]|nr:hypothetical protein [Erysipelotrichales bacterium]